MLQDKSRLTGRPEDWLKGRLGRVLLFQFRGLAKFFTAAGEPLVKIFEV
jgi:hypothetical protein